MNILSLLVLLPISLANVGPLPTYSDGIRKPHGSVKCPAHYVAVQDEAECMKIARGTCLSSRADECRLWSNPLQARGYKFAQNHGGDNQYGCYFDQGHGVLFNTNKHWSGKFNENDDRPICKLNPFKPSPGQYVEGVRKASGSHECPAGYVSIQDKAECKQVAEGDCLSSDSAECDIWSKWAKSYSFAMDHGTENQPGCYYDQDDGVVFNTNDRWTGNLNENNDRPLCKLNTFKPRPGSYVDGIRKVSGSTECPAFYHRIMDKAVCKQVAEGPCLSDRADECVLWSKWVNSASWAKDHGDSNQPGCYYDQDHGVVFNTGTGWNGKHNEVDDRPVCERDPDTFEESEIVRMLRELIVEAQEEIKSVNNAVTLSNQSVVDATGVHTDALEKEGEAFSAMENAKQQKNEAWGESEAARLEWLENQPGLTDEIELFKKVVGLLNDLKSGQGFVEKDLTLVKAFISSADQVNPDKLAKVIVLVTNLLTVAENELKALRDTIRQTTNKFVNAERRYTQAVATWSAAKSVTKAKEAILNTAQGKLDADVAHAAHRVPILHDEIALLEQSISIIKELA